MLAAFLAHQISVMSTKRRTAAYLADTTEEPDLKASQSDISRTFRSDFCRTCLSTSKLQPIFSNSFHQEMSQKLKLVTGLEIKKNDNLSQKICSKCLRIINVALNFRIKSAQTEKSLLKMARNIIKKESNNLEENEYLLPEINTKTVKVEYDSDTEDFGNEVNDMTPKLENVKVVEPKLEKITKKFQFIVRNVTTGEDETPMFADKKLINEVVPVEWDKNLKTYKRVTSELEKNDSTKDVATESLNASRAQHRVPLATCPPFTCPTCQRDCPTRAALATHYRGHTNYFICEDCGKRVLSKFALLQHQRALHGLTKIHKCSYCDYSAANKDGLMVHERRHTGERPFTCDSCGAGFASRRTLIQHIGLHMPDSIQCPYCPKRLRSERLLSNHKAEKHGKRYSYQCPSCPKSFGIVKTVRRHLQGVHKMPFREQPKIEKVLQF